MSRAQAYFLRSIPNSPTDDAGGGGGGGGGDTGGGGGGDTTPAGGGGGDTLGGGGGGDAPWFSTLPDDLKGQPGVTRHKTLTDAIQAGIAAEKRLGVPADQLVRLPTKPDDKEAVTAIYKALGAPDAPDGYQIAWEGATDEDKVVVGEFAKFMHEKGPFPPDALAAAAEFWRGKVAAQTEADLAAETATSEAAVATLKGELGAAYETTTQAVGKMIAEIGGAKLVEELDLNNKIGSSPELFRFLKKISDKLAEPGPGTDTQNADVGNKPLTPGEAKFKRIELENDPVKGKALRDGSHPMHAAVIAERNKLFEMENPQPAA